MRMIDIIKQKTTEELKDILRNPRAPLDAVLQYRITQELRSRSDQS